VFVEERKKEVENGCFGGMYEGCAPPLLGGEKWGAVASIKGKQYLSAFYGDSKIVGPMHALLCLCG